MTLREEVTQAIQRLNNPANKQYLDYLRVDRGLDQESIAKFQLGLDHHGNITIPLFDEGEVIGIKRRSNPFKDSNQKYLNPTGLSSLTFNAKDHPGSDTLVICEGEFDVISLEELGIDAVTKTTGAATGYDIDFIAEQIEKYDRVCIGFDNDEAGKAAAYNLALENIGTERLFLLFPPKSGNDWNDFLVNLKNNDAYKDQIRQVFQHEFMPKYLVRVDHFVREQFLESSQNKLDLIQLKDVEEIELNFFLEGLIPEKGITLITGAAGHMKSLLTLFLVVNSLTGQQPFHRLKLSKSKQCLLIDQENIHSEIRKRAEQFGSSENILLPTKSLYFDGDEALITEIKAVMQLFEIDLVVIDTFRRVNSNMDENNSKDVAKFFGKMIDLKREATVIILHHETKASAISGGGNYRGSGDIQGAVDSHLSVVKDHDRITITQMKTRYTAENKPITLRFITDEHGARFEFEAFEELDKSKAAITDELIQEYLSEYPNSDLNSIAEYVQECGGYSTNKVRERLQMMEVLKKVQSYMDNRKKLYCLLSQESEMRELI